MWSHPHTALATPLACSACFFFCKRISLHVLDCPWFHALCWVCCMDSVCKGMCSRRLSVLVRRIELMEENHSREREKERERERERERGREGGRGGGRENLNVSSSTCMFIALPCKVGNYSVYTLNIHIHVGHCPPTPSSQI